MRKSKCTFWVVRARVLKVVIAVLLCMFLLSLPMSSGEAMATTFFGTTRKIPIYCVENDKKEIAISFDAAWGSDKTQDILDILKEQGVTATFFLVGMWVDKNSDMTMKIDADGIEIGTHSNTHPDMTKLTESKIRQELETSMMKITSLTGKPVKVFRPPYGAYNNTLINVATSLGLSTIQWDVDSLDWKGISAGQISKNVLSKVGSGSIILCHNNADHIVEALPTIISTLKSNGYTFVKMSDLILKDNFTINHAGKQIKSK